MKINKLKRLVATAVFAGAVLGVSAEKVWHLVAEGMEEKVPVGDIEYIISKPLSGTMDIVLKDNAGVLEDVASASLTLCERAGLTQGVDIEATVLGPYNGIITVSGLPESSTVAVCNSQGMVVDTYTSQGPSQPILIDVAGYQNGIYILRTPSSSIKFLKQ